MRLFHSHPTCVLGLSLTALGIIRSLGRRGIEVFGLDYLTRPIAAYSKYCKYLKCPNPMTGSDELVAFLKKVRKRLPRDPVLIATNDEFTLFISRYREKLDLGFKFLLPPEDLVETLNDKRLFFDLAHSYDMPAPATFSPKTLADIRHISESITFPCVIKPAYGYLYDQFKFKGLFVENPSELLEKCKELADSLGDLIIQEVIQGHDHLQYSVAAYFNGHSDPLATFIARKTRQKPPGFGTGTFVISCSEPNIERLAISFLEKIHYRGIAELEFKRDARDGVVKMIEVNTRFWVQNNLATHCGVDLPYIAYADILGVNVERCIETKQSAKWLNAYDDFIACFGSSGYCSRGEITLRRWLMTLKGKKEYAVFAVDDIRPFLRASRDVGFMLSRTALNRLRRHLSSSKCM